MSVQPEPTPQSASDVVAPTPATQKDQLTLQVPGVYELSGMPRERYEFHIRRVAIEVLKEASNLATGQPRRGKKTREFHSSHVDSAFELVAGRGLRRRGRPWWFTAGRILQGFATAGIAVGGGFMAIPDSGTGWVNLFWVAIAVTVVITTVLEIADRSAS